MAKVDQIFRLVRIIKELERHKESGGLSYEELKERLENVHDNEYDAGRLQNEELRFSEKTFQRDRRLLSDLFDVEVVFEDKKWRLEENDFANKYAFFDNLLLMNAYRRSKELSNILLFERQQQSSLRFLEDIIEAIQERMLIRFDYTKFWEGVPHSRRVIPYAIKEYKRRWYLVGEDSTGAEGLKCFGLDRISHLEILDIPVVRKEVDFEKLFSNAFGISIATDEKPQEIVLSFNYEQGQYIKSLPLHPTQELLVDNDQEVRIRLRLVPTYDFVMEICARSCYVKVLSPSSLVQEVQSLLKAGYQQYEQIAH